MTEQKKSFAERFAKKSSFSGENLQKSQTPIQTKIASESSPIDLKKKAQSDLIYLVKGIDDERNAWYYVLVERPKLQLFLKALNDDIIHLENYGKVLYSAYGEHPPENITNIVKSEYGIS